MTIPWVLNLISNKWRAFKKWLTLSGYNDYTIASYFRKKGAHIGEHCRIQIRSIGTEPYLVTIGNHVFIAEGVVFHTHDGGTWIIQEKVPGILTFGTIIIEDNCLIGVRAQILPNVRIGRDSVIGAGSVVINDIPPNSIATGVPARVVNSSSKYEENCLAKWKDQKPPDLVQGSDSYITWWFSQENQVKLRRHLTDLFKEKTKLGENLENKAQKPQNPKDDVSH
jgi:acetyltransferase-like isoleucine patch superfamily enzyme